MDPLSCVSDTVSRMPFRLMNRPHLPLDRVYAIICLLEGLTVANPQTLESVPADGETIGEVMFRGNNVMMGYLKNPEATDTAFAGGWFRSGDLGVMHSDGYIELKDRSKEGHNHL